MTLEDVPNLIPPHSLLVIPVLPGRAEAWRRFAQELAGPQGRDWAEWQRRVGLRGLQVWAQASAQGMAVLVRARFGEPGCCPTRLINERWPFDRWLREQVRTLHGLDLAHCHAGTQAELMLESEEES